jgi:hypothetical protein
LYHLVAKQKSGQVELAATRKEAVRKRGPISLSLAAIWPARLTKF